MSKKLKIQISLFAFSILCNIIGISAICIAAGFAKSIFYVNWLAGWNHIFFQYVFIVIIMAVGIMSASLNAAQLDNFKLMKGLTIGITAYSTLLTIPLVMAFICFFFSTPTSTLSPFLDDMFGVIGRDIYTLLGSQLTLTRIMYSVGVVFSLICIGFPIYSCIDSIIKAKNRQA